MRTIRNNTALPIPVLRFMQKLGTAVRTARLRRRIPVALMAERASISRITLRRIEKGEPGAALGNYANVLYALGFLDRLAELFDGRLDTLGVELENERLPKRIRKLRRQIIPGNGAE